MHPLSESRNKRVISFLQCNKVKLVRGDRLRYNGRVFWANDLTKEIYYQWDEEYIRGKSIPHQFGHYTPNWSIKLPR